MINHIVIYNTSETQLPELADFCKQSDILYYDSINSVEKIGIAIINRITNVNLIELDKSLKLEIKLNFKQNHSGRLLLQVDFEELSFKIDIPKQVHTVKQIRTMMLCHSKFRQLLHLLELAFENSLRDSARSMIYSLSTGRKSSNADIFVCLYDSKLSLTKIGRISANYFIDLSSVKPIDEIKKIVLMKNSLKITNRAMKMKTVNYECEFEQIHNNSYLEYIRNVTQPKIKEMKNKSGVPFDAFDLELQTLIASTLYLPSELFDGLVSKKNLNLSLVNQIIQDQLKVIFYRYSRLRKIIPVDTLLKPKGIFAVKTRYWFDSGKIYAMPVSKQGLVDKSRAIEIEFKPVDEQTALAYEECFHYIHLPRQHNLAFGLYEKDSRFPYAISTLEYVGNREYKRAFLKQAGIDPTRCMDEIRLYSLPWSPVLTSSLLCNLVRKYLREHLPNITTTITAVNRNLFNGKYIDEAGYTPLALKPAMFSFKNMVVEGREIYYYQGTSDNFPKNSVMPLLQTVEYYRNIHENYKVLIPKGKVFRITMGQYLH